MANDWGCAGRTWHRYPYGRHDFTACGRVTPLAKRPTTLTDRPTGRRCLDCVRDEAKSAEFAQEQELSHA